MTTKTFIKWFFSRASHQKIDFRESCYGCGEVPTIIACDGTKIGIPRKDHISPIESTVGDSVIQSPHNRSSRCFLSYLAGFAPEKIRVATSQLRSFKKEVWKHQ